MLRGCSLVLGVLNSFAVLLIASTSAEPYIAATALVDVYAANSQNFGSGDSLGTLTVLQYVDDDVSAPLRKFVTITGGLMSIFPSSVNHGFHIHENAANWTAKCSALGKHYNPYGVNHGAQTANDTSKRHIGDLGNILSDQSGSIQVSIADSFIQLGTGNSVLDVAGRSIAIHIGTDDLGLGNANTSLANGNSGAIIACGNIVLQEKLASTAKANIYRASAYGRSDGYLGTITIRQYRDVYDNQPVYAVVSGALSPILPASQRHGFHIHESQANSSTDCSALGKHYNPLGTNHGSVNSAVRHVGDLGNIDSDADGVADIGLIQDEVIQVGTGNNLLDVVGRSIAVHMGTDDLGLGGTNTSLANGNSGQIIACGNIILLN